MVRQNHLLGNSGKGGVSDRLRSSSSELGSACGVDGRRLTRFLGGVGASSIGVDGRRLICFLEGAGASSVSGTPSVSRSARVSQATHPSFVREWALWGLRACPPFLTLQSIVDGSRSNLDGPKKTHQAELTASQMFSLGCRSAQGLVRLTLCDMVSGNRYDSSGSKEPTWPS